MDCAKAHDLMTAYLDDALPAAARRELERHIQDCPACASELQALRSLSQALHSLPQYELPAGFSERLHEALTAEPAPPKPGLWQRGWVKGLAAAACLVLVLGVVAWGGDLLLNQLNYSGDEYGQSFGTMDIAPEEAAMPYTMSGADDAMLESGRDMAVADVSEYEQEIGYDTGAAMNNVTGGSFNAGSGGEADQGIAVIERKIIKNAYLTLRVDHFQTAYDALNLLAGRYSGYIVSSNAYDAAGNGEMTNGYISMRVDASQLEAALMEIGTLGKVENPGSHADDITMEYYDVQARLEQYQAQEQRLNELLQQAVTVEEIIAVESELTRIRAERESLEGQIRYYDQMITLSSIDIDLYQPTPSTQNVQLSGWAGLWQRIQEGFISGINNLLNGLATLVVWFFKVLPVLIIVVILVIILWLIFRRRKKIPKIDK